MTEPFALPRWLTHAVRMTPHTVFRLSTVALVLGLVLWAVSPGLAPAVLRAGLIALMSVPFLRVSVYVLVFLWRRDWLALAATAAVLAVVMTTLALALRH